MNRKMLYAAASGVALAAFAGMAMAQTVAIPKQTQADSRIGVDANGVKCNGVLDGSGMCLDENVTKNSADRPYRRYGKGDAIPKAPSPTGERTDSFARRSRQLVYIAVPGGKSDDEESSIATGEGIIVLDPKAHYKFVKRIPLQNLPASMAPEEVSAMMASPATNMLYVSTRGHLIAVDLATDKIVWNNTYEPGTCCERGQVTPDGLTLEVGSDLKNFHRVIDAKTGAVKGIIETPMSNFNHNMSMTPDGKTVFDAPNGPTLTVASMDTMKAIKTITFSDHIRPFVINSDGSRVYANLNNLLGFEIADVAKGKVIKRVEAPGEIWKAKWADPNNIFFGHGGPMHAIGLTPDEGEMWIGDAINNQVLVYDNEGKDNWTLNNSKTVKLEHTTDWITMGLDGKLAYLSSGDVVDVAAHKIVGKMTDEYGNRITSEKFLDMQFNNKGHLTRVVNQFANGDPQAVAARLAREKNKQARN